MLRDFSLRDFGASLNTVESYTNESSQGKIGLCETVNKQKCTHLGMFLASDIVKLSAAEDFSLLGKVVNLVLTDSADAPTCEYNGIEFVQVGRFYPSSKTCHKCGCIKHDLKLSDRTYICSECGEIIDRDLNAAINLANYSKV